MALDCRTTHSVLGAHNELVDVGCRRDAFLNHALELALDVLLVADDVGNAVWRVAAAGAKPPVEAATTK